MDVVTSPYNQELQSFQWNHSRITICPSLCIAIWHFILLFFGCNALGTDLGIRDIPCGQTTHAYKYALMNTFFALFSITTYCFFPGGGEGARARAMVMTIIHLAFFVWGFLMWYHLSPECSKIMEDNYTDMMIFLYVCVVHNALFGLLFLIHEFFAAEMLGFDLTLAAEVSVESPPSRPMNGSHMIKPKFAQPIVTPIKQEQNDGLLPKFNTDHLSKDTSMPSPDEHNVGMRPDHEHEIP